MKASVNVLQGPLTLRYDPEKAGKLQEEDNHKTTE